MQINVGMFRECLWCDLFKDGSEADFHVRYGEVVVQTLADLAATDHMDIGTHLVQNL